jgi:hypothetical protein
VRAKFECVNNLREQRARLCKRGAKVQKTFRRFAGELLRDEVPRRIAFMCIVNVHAFAVRLLARVNVLQSPRLLRRKFCSRDERMRYAMEFSPLAIVECCRYRIAAVRRLCFKSSLGNWSLGNGFGGHAAESPTKLIACFKVKKS